MRASFRLLGAKARGPPRPEAEAGRIATSIGPSNTEATWWFFYWATRHSQDWVLTARVFQGLPRREALGSWFLSPTRRVDPRDAVMGDLQATAWRPCYAGLLKNGDDTSSIDRTQCRFQYGYPGKVPGTVKQHPIPGTRTRYWVPRTFLLYCIHFTAGDN